MQRFSISAVLGFVLLAFVHCAAADAPESRAAAGGDVGWAVAVFPNGEEFELEVVDEPESRRLGYMYREQVGEREGMLFVFTGDRAHGIWMKNCKVALDILWLDPRGRVVHMSTDAQPCPEEGPCPSHYPDQASRYVLEVAAGTAADLGLRQGDRIMLLPEFPPLAVR